MTTPPLWMTINVRAPGKEHPHRFWLWLPLFIIGPLFVLFLLAAFLIALPFILIAWLFTMEARWWRYLHGLPGILRVLWAMAGLRVKVHDGETRVHIAVY